MSEEQDQIAALRRITETQDRELDRLRAYVKADCKCPRCDTDHHCLEGCTFLEDVYDGWERMTAARKAMWGDSTKGETNETES